MSLADEWDSGSWFPEGSHVVTIKGFRFFTANSGTPGVEFELSDGQREGKATFWLTKKSVFRLTQLAKDCGITKEQAVGIDWEGQKGFRVFVGKRFVAVFIKGEKFTEFEDSAPLDKSVTPPSRPAPAPPPAADEPPPDDDPLPADYTPDTSEPEGEEIPF
jgi:hypothetical protein